MSTPADGHQPPQFQPGPGQPGQYQQPYGGQGYPPQQPPKKKGGCLKIGCIGLAALVALILVIVVIVAAVRGGGDGADESNNDGGGSSSAQSNGDAEQDVAEETAAAGDSLTLEGTSTGAASSNYGPLGSSSTADFTGTWTEEVPDADPADGYGVTIQDSSGADDAEVSCKITKDGEVVAEEKATGAYSITTCTLPLF
ncbi:MAG: hypothetical protein L0G19_03550 [Micrococcales bacterium]|nr:hypothetical protein [Micrococcales bacterium]